MVCRKHPHTKISVDRVLKKSGFVCRLIDIELHAKDYITYLPTTQRIELQQDCIRKWLIMGYS